MEETSVERRGEKNERITKILEKARALYKENSKNGEVCILAKDMFDEEQAWTMETIKIAEIVNGDAVTPDGYKIPLWCIDDAEMVDEA